MPAGGNEASKVSRGLYVSPGANDTGEPASTERQASPATFPAYLGVGLKADARVAVADIN